MSNEAWSEPEPARLGFPKPGWMEIVEKRDAEIASLRAERDRLLALLRECREAMDGRHAYPCPECPQCRMLARLDAALAPPANDAEKGKQHE